MRNKSVKSLLLIFCLALPASAQAATRGLEYYGGPVVGAHRLHLMWITNGGGYDNNYRSRVSNFFLRDLPLEAAKPNGLYSLLAEYKINFSLISVDSMQVAMTSKRASGCPREISNPCMDEGSISVMINNARKQAGLPLGFNDVYLVVAPKRSGVCMTTPDIGPECYDGAVMRRVGFRGYHNSSPPGLSAVQSKNAPLLWGVTINQTNADRALYTLVHEHLEIITDPITPDKLTRGVNGWFSSDFGEMADACGFEGLGSMQRIGQADYWLIAAWSNRFKKCVMDSSGKSYPLIPGRASADIK